MMGNSPLQYFQSFANKGNGPGILEGKVAFCYSLMREASMFIAAGGINNGVGSVSGYIPQLHSALIGLAGFETSLLTARSYGAYNWPNIELRDFANSIVDLGIHLKHHTETNHQAKMPEAKFHAAGSALQQFGIVLADVADATYFCAKDMYSVVLGNRPSFELSREIVNGLAVDALSQSFIGGSTPGDLVHVRGLINEYVKIHKQEMEKLKAAKRGMAQ